METGLNGYVTHINIRWVSGALTFTGGCLAAMSVPVSIETTAKKIKVFWSFGPDTTKTEDRFGR